MAWLNRGFLIYLTTFCKQNARNMNFWHRITIIVKEINQFSNRACKFITIDFSRLTE